MDDEAKKLAESVIKWWEEHRYDCYFDGDDERNLYEETPEFVVLAANYLGLEI
jgi:hypothetical protein